MAAASKTDKSEIAGEAQDVLKREAKLVGLIHSMLPESRSKCSTLQDGVTFLLSELNRTKIALDEARKVLPSNQGSSGGNAEILAGISRLEASLKNVKEQFSTMRQYSIGAK